jgi:hypothetical protein
MALLIKYDEDTKYGRTPEGRWKEWHVGEPIPEQYISRVLIFQADGDELNLFLDAMHASRGEANGICWEKGKSFRPLIQPESKKIFRIWYKLGPKFGTARQLVPTGIVRKTQKSADRWIKHNPAVEGEWSVREENV